MAVLDGLFNLENRNLGSGVGWRTGIETPDQDGAGGRQICRKLCFLDILGLVWKIKDSTRKKANKQRKQEKKKSPTYTECSSPLAETMRQGSLGGPSRCMEVVAEVVCDSQRVSNTFKQKAFRVPSDGLSHATDATPRDSSRRFFQVSSCS